jgi:hypothetical protein
VPIVKRSRQLWTPEMDAELLAYYKHGLRPAYIAEQMERTIASVEGRYVKLKRKGQADAQKMVTE